MACMLDEGFSCHAKPCAWQGEDRYQPALTESSAIWSDVNAPCQLRERNVLLRHTLHSMTTTLQKEEQ